ncbi:MAG: sugar phosphate isomerase/epimerase family protein [Armatimonadota bacterium]
MPCPWGYSAVELGACDLAGEFPCADLGTWDAEAAVVLAQSIRELGLDISALQVHVDYVFADGRERERRLDHTRRMIDLAHAMAVGVVHTVSGPLPPGLDEAKAWDDLAEAYDALCSHACAAGVSPAIEPVFVYLVGNLSTTKRLAEAMGRDDLYINFDPSHFPYHREDPEGFLEAFGPRIVHAHAKDARIIPLQIGSPLPANSFYMGNEEAFTFAPPGAGVLDWPAVVKGLQATGFDGVVSLELGHGIPDEVGAARDTARSLQALI